MSDRKSGVNKWSEKALKHFVRHAMKRQYLQLSSILSDLKSLAGTTNTSEGIPDIRSLINVSARRSVIFVGTAGIIGSCILGCGSSGTEKSEKGVKGSTVDVLGMSTDSRSSIFSSRIILFESFVPIPAQKASSISEMEASNGMDARKVVDLQALRLEVDHVLIQYHE
jgi:hypothetical protein